MPPRAVPNSLAQHILSLLPTDGTPVANRIMRAMLAKKLERRIETDSYFEALSELATTGAIGRSRGRGGTIFLASSPPEIAPPPPEPIVEDRWAEADLMYPTKLYLERHFAPSLDLPSGSTFFVSDTSNIGPRDGQWARPDFVLVTVMRFSIVPGSQLDVHSFELKTASGGTVPAVHEALAQTRFTNFGHLIWHVPLNSDAEARLPEIEAQCEKHGVGLILIRDPENLASWEVLLDAEQTDTPPATIDAFLQSRLPPAHVAKVRDAARGERS